MIHLNLIDIKPPIVEAFHEFFDGIPDVTIGLGDFLDYPADAVVSPANSFGFMDGGFDMLLSMKFGWGVQELLQDSIKAEPMKELLIGDTMVIPTGNDEIPYVIAAPTMRVPMNHNIHTSVNAYLAAKAAFISADEYPDINRITMTGLCTGVGAMPPEISARQIYAAYCDVFGLGREHFKEWLRDNNLAVPDYDLSFPEDFGIAQKYHYYLNPLGRIYD